MADCWVNVPNDQEIESVPVSGYAPIYFPPEGAKCVFFFTEETFLKVYSALRNGAQTTYPDEWLQVLWYFQQNVEFPVDLCDEIAAAILTCEDVQLAIASVIETSEPIQEAIEGLVTTSPTVNNYITNIVQQLTPEQLTGELIYGSCDDGVLAGKMLALVGSLDQNNIDALELIEVGTNDEEKVAIVIEGIPVVGELPFDQIIDFMQDLLEDFAENYVAASTTERKEALARDLWCFAKEQTDCSINYELLFEFFQTRATSGLSVLSTAIDVINFVRDGDFDNDDALFNGLMAVQIAFVNAGQQFFGVNLPKIGALTRDASPSTIWQEWGECGEPPPDPECVNLLYDQNGWVITNGNGSWTSGQGFAPLFSSGNYFLQINHPAYTPSMVTDRVVVKLTTAVTDVILLHGNSSNSHTYTGSSVSTVELSAATVSGWADYNTALGLRIVLGSTSGMNASTRITQVCIYPA